MSFSKKIFSSATGALLLATAMNVSAPAPAAYADDAGAFVGGIMAARIGQNMRSRTQAEQQQAQAQQQQAQAAQDQAYYSQQQVQQAPPPPAEQTVEERLAQLDKLAAGGYITADEYKKKKQAILDEM